MDSVRIVHTADWGVRSEEKYKGKIPQLGFLEELFLTARDADVVVVAGDMFGNAVKSRDDPAYQRVEGLLKRFRDASNVPVIILDTTTHAYTKTILGLAEIDDVRVVHHRQPKAWAPIKVSAGGGDIHVVPVTFLDQTIKDRAKKKINGGALAEATRIAERQRAAKGGYWIATVHGNDTDDFDRDDIESLVGPGRFHYVALGHVDSANRRIAQTLRGGKKALRPDTCQLSGGLDTALYPGAPDHSVKHGFEGKPRYLDVEISSRGVRALQRPWEEG